MAKITVCDICKAKDKLTETDTYMRVRGRSDLRLDYCKEHKKDIPKSMSDYTKLVNSFKKTRCKHCGKPTGSPDSDVLCKQCRETFGHTFYSEL